MNEAHPSLADIGLLSELDEAARAALEQRCRWQRFAAHTQIIDQNSDSSDVYFVLEGLVRVVNYSMSGREITLDEVGVGGYFGEFAALDGQPRSANIVALTDALVASITQDDFLKLLRDRPAIGIEVMLGLVRLIRTSTDRIMALSTIGACNRIHSELLREARSAPGESNRAVISPFPLHGDIASRVSTTRETVTRVLGDLKRLGLIERANRKLVILDVDRLEKMVEHLQVV